MTRLPIRLRLTLWSMMVVAVAVLVCGAVAAWFVHRRELLEIDAELRDETRHFFDELDHHGGPRFKWAQIEMQMREWLPRQTPPRLIEIHSGGELRWRSHTLPPGTMALETGLRMMKVGGNRVRLLVTEREGVTFAVAADLEEVEAAVENVGLGILAGLPLALAFAWFGSRWVAARAMKPVEQITAAADLVTAAHLDRRVPMPPVADEIQRLAQVLNDTLERLERSYHQAVRFSADASHELKTPLTVMRTSIEALMETPSLGEHEHAALAGLMEQTHLLSNITASLLLLSRADAGRLSLDLTQCDLAALTEGCIDDARIMAEPRRVSVECAAPERAPARVDALRFAQIASNLFDNAIKYNQLGGQVRVSLTDEGAAWRLVVGNTGPGISPEDRGRLFERFFRAQHTAETAGCGLGLGLARELARAHGGDVTLARSDDGWTEFAATFPKAGPNDAL